MAANKIKFEMTLKELTFKFEGDYEHGQRLQLGINKALSDLGKLQGAASGFEETKLIEATPAAYKEVARTQALAGKCWNHPVISNGRIYARSTKEGVCLDVSEKSAHH